MGMRSSVNCNHCPSGVATLAIASSLCGNNEERNVVTTAMSSSVAARSNMRCCATRRAIIFLFWVLFPRGQPFIYERAYIQNYTTIKSFCFFMPTLRLLAAFTSLTHPQPPPQAGALVAFSRLRIGYNLRLCNLVYNYLMKFVQKYEKSRQETKIFVTLFRYA